MSRYNLYTESLISYLYILNGKEKTTVVHGYLNVWLCLNKVFPSELSDIFEIFLENSDRA